MGIWNFPTKELKRSTENSRRAKEKKEKQGAGAEELLVQDCVCVDSSWDEIRKKNIPGF